MDKVNRFLCSSVFAILVILFGLLLRGANLDAPSLWEDEAESSINALSILENGYPGDSYLGLPIFENIMIKPWPDHEQYEFKDISYSDSGLAAYHGWLPLYAIAASLAAFDIPAGAIDEQRQVQHSAEARTLRTIAPRLPSLFFSLIFLAAAYLLGKELHGRDLAITLLIAVAITNGFVDFGRYARYYSATFALTTVVALFLIRLRHRQSWTNTLVVAVALSLLFHTHTLSFLVACLLFVFLNAKIFLQKREFIKPVVIGIIVAAATIPWILYVDYLHTVSFAPKAFEIMDFPEDLIRFPLERPQFTLPILLGLGLLVFGKTGLEHIPVRYSEPFSRYSEAILLLTLWSGLSFLCFWLFIPSASFFDGRIKLIVGTPGMMLYCITLVVAMEILFKRHHVVASVVVLCGVLFFSGKVFFEHLLSPQRDSAFLKTIELLEQLELAPNTMLYASPNHHLVFQYYAGLPIQSIAAVRKRFLDETPNPVVFIDVLSAQSSSMEAAQEDADALGLEKTEAELGIHLQRIGLHSVQGGLADAVQYYYPQDIDLNVFEQFTESEQLRYMAMRVRRVTKKAPILRGGQARQWEDIWYRFFFYYVNPEQRQQHKNFAERLQKGTALALPWNWVIYESAGAGNVPVFNEAALEGIYSKACDIQRKTALRKGGDFEIKLLCAQLQ